MDKDQTTTPGTTCPTLYDECEGSYRPLVAITVKMQETGPTLYRPYPRRLEYLTICKCHCKGSIFSSVTLSVGLVWGSNPRPPVALPTELTDFCSHLRREAMLKPWTFETK